MEARSLSECGGHATALCLPAMPAASPRSDFFGPPAWPASTKRWHGHRTPKEIVLVALFVACSLPLSAQQSSTPPGNFDQLSAQAEAARTADRIDEAIGLYRKALSLRPGWAEGWWNLGTLQYDRDQFADAATAFGKVTNLTPKLGSAWVMLGLCDYRLGRNDAALQHIQKGRELGTVADPRFRNVMLYHEGLLLMLKENFEKAQETLASVARDGVGSEDLRIALGMSVLRLSPSVLRAAGASLRQILFRAGHAEELAAQEKFGDALQEYQRLIADFPQQLNVHYAYARFLMASGDPNPEKAVAAFQREIENHPQHVLARLSIASLRAPYDPNGGLRYAEEAVRLNPHIPTGHYLLGLLLLRTDQTARTIQELEIARKLMPDDARVYYALSRAYARANRKKDAEEARAVFQRLKGQSEQTSVTPVK